MDDIAADEPRRIAARGGERAEQAAEQTSGRGGGRWATLLRGARHRIREVETEHRRIRVSRSELAQRNTGPASGVQDRRNVELHESEPFRHALADLPLEHRGVTVGRGGALERASD